MRKLRPVNLFRLPQGERVLSYSSQMTGQCVSQPRKPNIYPETRPKSPTANLSCAPRCPLHNGAASWPARSPQFSPLAVDPQLCPSVLLLPTPLCLLSPLALSSPHSQLLHTFTYKQTDKWLSMAAAPEAEVSQRVFIEPLNRCEETGLQEATYLGLVHTEISPGVFRLSTCHLYSRTQKDAGEGSGGVAGGKPAWEDKWSVEFMDKGCIWGLLE